MIIDIPERSLTIFQKAFIYSILDIILTLNILVSYPFSFRETAMSLLTIHIYTLHTELMCYSRASLEESDRVLGTLLPS